MFAVLDRGTVQLAPSHLLVKVGWLEDYHPKTVRCRPRHPGWLPSEFHPPKSPRVAPKKRWMGYWEPPSVRPVWDNQERPVRGMTCATIEEQMAPVVSVGKTRTPVRQRLGPQTAGEVELGSETTRGIHPMGMCANTAPIPVLGLSWRIWMILDAAKAGAVGSLIVLGSGLSLW